MEHEGHWLRRAITALGLTVALAPTGAHAEAWQLWASGLPGGFRPRLTVAADHSIYYATLATGGTLGVIHRAPDARAASGTFTPLPPIPYVSITNNIQALTTNAASEPVAAIFHYYNGSDPQGTALHLNDPVVFVYDVANGQWRTGVLDVPVSLGAFSLAKSPNGDIWLGGKWSRVYRSQDGGQHFTATDESAYVAASAPCYYPTLSSGSTGDGAIYSINVDGRGWVYAGTETAGIVYSPDSGQHWYPLDTFACLGNDPTQKNPSSPMEPASRSGNIGAIGFTRDNDPVWSGVQLFQYANWDSSVGMANLAQHTVSPAVGFDQYFIFKGLQVSKIVTSQSGTMFLHSGANASFDPNPPPPPYTSLYSKGLYRSDDGIHWTVFNTGITGNNDGASEGALAVDGNRVFTATSNGSIWYVDIGSPLLFVNGFE